MRMIAHSYDTYDHAVRVVHALEAAGVPHDDVSLMSGDKDRTVATNIAGDTAADTAKATGAGTGATVGTVLGGGAGLLAGLGSLAIPGVGPVVAAGWLIATLAGAGVGAAAGGLLGSLTGAGVEEADAKGYAEHVGRGGTLVTVRANDDDAARVEYILEHGEAQAATTTPAMAPTAAAAPATAAPATAAGMAAPAAAPVATGTETGNTIKVLKEDLVVGKREVEGGAVRVTSHVVETPVEEKVGLHEERVNVVRRPVNRPLTGVAADAFRERTVSATATSEEAVVGKEARVVEEIGLRKEASDRTETVRDTVRETKVDVEQVPGSAAATRAAGTTQTTGPTGTAGTTGQPNALRDNAATRAVDSTLGTNVSGENPGRKV
jgi:stress response protein YsnF